MIGTPTGDIRFRTHTPFFGAPVLILQVSVAYGDGPPDAHGLPAYLAGVGWRDATSQDLTHPNIISALREKEPQP